MAEPADSTLRPRSGDTAADLRWRAGLRARTETDPQRDDSVPVRTGERLAATVALLSRNSLFARCTTAELERLAATAYAMTFEPGDLLCTEGAELPECYIVEEGQAVVTIGRKGAGRGGRQPHGPGVDAGRDDAPVPGRGGRERLTAVAPGTPVSPRRAGGRRRSRPGHGDVEASAGSLPA